MISRVIPLIVVVLLFLPVIPAGAIARYIPHQGDYFSYHEVIDVGNGQGSYLGYSDHTVVNGKERMNTVYTNGTVASNYTYTWNFNNYTGGTQSGKSSGNFTWSSTTFLYVKRTDNQTGYLNPTVWFYVDNTTQPSGSFRLLDTQMTVTSKSYSYLLASQNSTVKAISAQGSSSYQRNDAYGKFNAAYTWTTYFDPLTGYVIGYVWNEQDSDSSGNGFTYTETLYVTSTSYPLTRAPANNSSNLLLYLGYVAIAVLVILIITVVAIALSRRRKTLPQHPPPMPPAYAPQPIAPPQEIDLIPKQPPVQQIVIKEIVKVKCRYCGALIDSTVQACPFCGAPRT